jgi:hypothetical protein
MGGPGASGASMYEQVEDTEPKAAVTAEQVAANKEAANKAAEEAAAQAKADLAADQTGALST